MNSIVKLSCKCVAVNAIIFERLRLKQLLKCEFEKNSTNLPVEDSGQFTQGILVERNASG